MMRTLEVVIVISILIGTLAVVSYFAVLPSPREVSPLNLRRLALTTLQTLDSSHDLSMAAFDVDNVTVWNNLQVALSAMLPPDIIYNLTILQVNSDASGTTLYNPVNKADGTTATISNAGGLGVASDSSQYFVASSNVTFNVTPEQIGEHGGGGTLYILNCSDANGWWTTGYTSQSLAADLQKLMSPYFVDTVMVQNTAQLGEILNGRNITSSGKENVTGAVIINTYGEAVPMPSSYATDGYYEYASGQGSYNKYCYILGQKTRQYNWTWASIVGYPLYYVANTGLFPDGQNGWGVYGMRAVGDAGFNAFLRGINGMGYTDQWWNGTAMVPAWWQNSGGGWTYDHGWITTEIKNVPISPEASYYSNYYGIYPGYHQTATRALPTWIASAYNLRLSTPIFANMTVNNVDYQPGAIYRNSVSGAFLALGLTRTPDVRLTALGLLADYKPRLYRSEYTAYGTSRVVVLQLGLAGGT